MNTCFKSIQEFIEYRDKAKELKDRINTTPRKREEGMYLQYLYNELLAIRTKHTDFEPTSNSLTYLNKRINSFIDRARNIKIVKKYIGDAKLYKDLQEWKEYIVNKNYSLSDITDFSNNLVYYLGQPTGIDTLTHLKKELKAAGTLYPEVIKRNTLSISKERFVDSLSLSKRMELSKSFNDFYWKLIDKESIRKICIECHGKARTTPTTKEEFLYKMLTEDRNVKEFIDAFILFHKIQIKTYKKYLEERINVPMILNIHNHLEANEKLLSYLLQAIVHLMQKKMFEYIMQKDTDHLLLPLQDAYQRFISLNSIEQVNDYLNSLDHLLGGYTAPMNFNPLDAIRPQEGL